MNQEMNNSCQSGSGPVRTQEEAPTMVPDHKKKWVDEYFDILYHSRSADEFKSLFDRMSPDIRSEFNPSLTDHKGYTALHICCILGNIDVAKWLIRHYLEVLRLSFVDLSQPDRNMYTALHYACNEDHSEMIQLLLFDMLEEYSDLPNFNRELQIQSNLSCISQKNIDTVSYLSGVNMMPIYSTGGRSLMHYCAEQGAVDSAKVVMLFLDQYGDESIAHDILEQDLDGNTPYQLSVLHNHASRSEAVLDYFYELQLRADPATIKEDGISNDEKKRITKDIRRKQAERAAQRKIEREKQTSTNYYVPKHQELLSLEESFLDAKLLNAIKANEFDELLTKETDEVYSFPMAKVDQFCSILLDEVSNYEQSGREVQRPNSMNNYGIVLEQLGIEVSISDIINKVMLPISKHVYPHLFTNYDTAKKKDFHAFMVRYALGEDIDLDEHVDSSTITLNLSLGQEFTGGEVYFKEPSDSSSQVDRYCDIPSIPGRALIHLGSHSHGARPLTSGVRNNLIIWWRL